jgi:hypothetical protein
MAIKVLDDTNPIDARPPESHISGDLVADVNSVDGDPRAAASDVAKRILALARPMVDGGWSRRFKEKPVDVIEFCEKYVGEPLFPRQAKICLDIWGVDPMVWRGPSPTTGETIRELDAFWGKGAGKDRGTALGVFCYAAYKLVNLRDPQTFLGKPSGDLVDLANVSFNARQAKGVFFSHLKSVMRKTRDPNSGRNWFEKYGLDLSEGGDCIQGRDIYLDQGRTITIHALDSKEYTGEGMGLLIALFDELGSFGSPAKALALLDALQETSVSRYKKLSLTVALSYLYARNDAMQVRVAQARKAKSKRWLVDEATTAQANPTFKRDDPYVADLYLKNPERAKRVYENILSADTNAFFGMPEEIRGRANWGRENPVNLPDEMNWWTDNLAGLPLKEWFRGMPGRAYSLRFDLAKGKARGDKVGLALGHGFQIVPTYSDEYAKAYEISTGKEPDEGTIPRKEGAVFYDLLLQVRAPAGAEVRFQDLIDFAKRLKTLGFDIQRVTYDGWQSVGELQRMREAGFDARLLSVDKTNGPAELMKELVYSGRADYLPHPTFVREAEELIVDDRGKVDHPEKSRLRDVEEGEGAGSKDVWDAACGVADTLLGQAEDSIAGAEAGQPEDNAPFAM